MHHPKGSMCTACAHRDRDCTHLDFQAMSVIERYGLTFAVVRCTDFTRPTPDAAQSVLDPNADLGVGRVTRRKPYIPSTGNAFDWRNQPSEIQWSAPKSRPKKNDRMTPQERLDAATAFAPGLTHNFRRPGQ